MEAGILDEAKRQQGGDVFMCNTVMLSGNFGTLLVQVAEVSSMMA